MELLFLGTGAADYSPSLTREHPALDADYRRASALLVNGELLVDCGPHALNSMALTGILPSSVKLLLVTHFHADHFDAENAARLASDGTGLELICSADAPELKIDGAAVRPLRLFETVETRGYKITAAEANHDCFPAHYIIEDADGRRLFYGCDGAWLMRRTWDAICETPFDFIVLDATVGDLPNGARLGSHNSLPMCRIIAEGLRERGAVAEGGAIILSHIARTLHEPHDKLAAAASRDGMTAAFDGMRLST